MEDDILYSTIVSVTSNDPYMSPDEINNNWEQLRLFQESTDGLKWSIKALIRDINPELHQFALKTIKVWIITRWNDLKQELQQHIKMLLFDPKLWVSLHSKQYTLTDTQTTLLNIIGPEECCNLLKNLYTAIPMMALHVFNSFTDKIGNDIYARCQLVDGLINSGIIHQSINYALQIIGEDPTLGCSILHSCCMLGSEIVRECLSDENLLHLIEFISNETAAPKAMQVIGVCLHHRPLTRVINEFRIPNAIEAVLDKETSPEILIAAGCLIKEFRTNKDWNATEVLFPLAMRLFENPNDDVCTNIVLYIQESIEQFPELISAWLSVLFNRFCLAFENEIFDTDIETTFQRLFYAVVRGAEIDFCDMVIQIFSERIKIPQQAAALFSVFMNLRESGVNLEIVADAVEYYSYLIHLDAPLLIPQCNAFLTFSLFLFRSKSLSTPLLERFFMHLVSSDNCYSFRLKLLNMIELIDDQSMVSSVISNNLSIINEVIKMWTPEIIQGSNSLFQALRGKQRNDAYEYALKVFSAQINSGEYDQVTLEAVLLFIENINEEATGEMVSHFMEMMQPFIITNDYLFSRYIHTLFMALGPKCIQLFIGCIEKAQGTQTLSALCEVGGLLIRNDKKGEWILELLLFLQGPIQKQIQVVSNWTDGSEEAAEARNLVRDFFFFCGEAISTLKPSEIAQLIGLACSLVVIGLRVPRILQSIFDFLQKVPLEQTEILFNRCINDFLSKVIESDIDPLEIRWREPIRSLGCLHTKLIQANPEQFKKQFFPFASHYSVSTDFVVEYLELISSDLSTRGRNFVSTFNRIKNEYKIKIQDPS